ncbi:Uncharacterised protein [Mycobacterium tuberculosis]|uniref:Uncharacterized protein n=1 Tax=Mycobacterium tuberculosis TaxID=1773 RepID=A0A654U1V2_MYCTX|nr:Uncharacterised protein [Mycobacterium tuberculosis]
MRRVELAQPDTHVAARRAPLRGVVHQVKRHPRQSSGIAINLPPNHLDVEKDIVAPPPDPLQAAVDDVSHVDRLVHHFSGVASGQVHQIAYQCGQFLDLSQHIGTQVDHLLLG